MQSHSESFYKLFPNYQHGEILQAPPLPLASMIREKELSYDELTDLLREINDAQLGIVSKLDKTGQWLRDATNALPLSDRLSHDAPIIAVNNMLLRCLARMRAIDYAIKKKYSQSTTSEHHAICDHLNQELSLLIQNSFDTIQQSTLSDTKKLNALKKAELAFDTVLVEALHKANMTKSCSSKADAQKLLSYYRNLSSLLVPARTLVTLTYDQNAGVLQRETQYPITKKTEKQKATIQQLKDIDLFPNETDRNAHNTHRYAIQEADCIFADLLLQDDRALPPLARKTHLSSLKNGFIVKNELILVAKEELTLEVMPQNPETDTFWIVRTGVPVFVGNGETFDRIQESTCENLEQIRSAAQEKIGPHKLHIHLACLNTDSLLGKQHIMVKHLFRATRNNSARHDRISYLPINIEGTFRIIDIDPELLANNEHPGHTFPLQKADRLAVAIDVILRACSIPSTISVVHCASGIDRTGTTVERVTQCWTERWYAERALDTAYIEISRAEGANAAEITSHHVPGTAGMKKISQAINLFGGKTTFRDDVSKELYRNVADDNKKNPVGAVTFMKRASPLAVKEYFDNLHKFDQAIEDFNQQSAHKYKKNVYHSAQTVSAEIQRIATKNPERLNPRHLADLSLILDYGKRILGKHNDSSMLKKFTLLSQKFSKKQSPHWKALGIALLLFSSALLILTAVLAFVPSFGASSLLITGLSVGSVASLAGSIGIFKYHSSNPLSRSVKTLTTAISLVEQTPPLSPVA